MISSLIIHRIFMRYLQDENLFHSFLIYSLSLYLSHHNIFFGVVIAVAGVDAAE